MDAITRNNIFIENMELINRTMHRHRLLLFALHLDRDDVYQELAIAALRAIESFDPSRSNSIKVHIWAKLQYAILDIKERHKPHGLAAFDRFGTSVWSLELAEEYGFSLVETSFEEQQDSELHLRQALSRLEPQERQAIVLYLDGKRPVRRAEKCSFQTALDKLRDYYLAVQYVPQANQ